MIGYMDGDEQDPGRTAWLIASIRSQCVNIPMPRYRANLVAMNTWCYTNIGPRRPSHPIHEAEQGFIDHLEGDWIWAQLYDEEDNSIASFWFARAEDKTLFTLTWMSD